MYPIWDTYLSIWEEVDTPWSCLYNVCAVCTVLLCSNHSYKNRFNVCIINWCMLFRLIKLGVDQQKSDPCKPQKNKNDYAQCIFDRGVR